MSLRQIGADIEVDLLAVGTLGMSQNFYAAGAVRSFSAMGVHLKMVQSITGTKVAQVLKSTEHQFPGMGLSLVPIFFPGGMRVTSDDMGFWQEAKRSLGPSPANIFNG